MDNRNEEIRERNERFAKLQRRDQRIVIAQDVLMRLSKGQYRADHTYGILLNGNMHDIASGNEETRCQVCALGAMMMSSLALGGSTSSVKLQDAMVSWGEARDTLREYFGLDEMLLIELFYEGQPMAVHAWPDDMLRWAHRWANTCGGVSSRGRMRHIMQNIVDNDGNFDAEKLMQKFPEYNG